MVIKSSTVFEATFSRQVLEEVASNHISQTTARGVDGINLEVFMSEVDYNLSLIEARSLDGTYKFTRYREKLILKGAASPPRRVSIPTIRDRIVLRSLNDFLCKVFADCRPPHAHPIVARAIHSFKKSLPSDSFVKLDIKGFYDNIDHKILKVQLRKRIKHDAALELIMRAITTPTGGKAVVNGSNVIGVPQGLSISNILASIYMLDLDNEYQSRLDLDYHRYVDDILIRVDNSDAEVLANRVARRLKKSRKLIIHPLGSGKSAIYSCYDGVDYLGYKLKGSSISVRDESIKKLMTSVMRIILGITNDNADKSVWRLNLIISGCRIQSSNVGWLFYFSQIDDHSVLFRIDNQIKSMLKKIGRPDLVSKCKSFIKAHREIKYNFENTSYVFNFDMFSRPQMLEAIYLIRPESKGKWDLRSDQEINSIFFRTMYREAREMERDTLGSFS